MVLIHASLCFLKHSFRVKDTQEMKFTSVGWAIHESKSNVFSHSWATLGPCAPFVIGSDYTLICSIRIESLVVHSTLLGNPVSTTKLTKKNVSKLPPSKVYLSFFCLARDASLKTWRMVFAVSNRTGLCYFFIDKIGSRNIAVSRVQVFWPWCLHPQGQRWTFHTLISEVQRKPFWTFLR